MREGETETEIDRETERGGESEIQRGGERETEKGRERERENIAFFGIFANNGDGIYL